MEPDPVGNGLAGRGRAVHNCELYCCIGASTDYDGRCPALRDQEKTRNAHSDRDAGDAGDEYH